VPETDKLKDDDYLDYSGDNLEEGGSILND
jgi:hypothetical protein